MIRNFLLAFGWVSIIGSCCDGAIALMLLIQITLGTAPLDISLDAHLKDHLPFLYWVKDVARAILPANFFHWLFALPAIIYFPARIPLSVLVGNWALASGRKMKKRAAQPQTPGG